MVDSSAVKEHAKGLLERISMERSSDNERNRQTIFVADSGGGLIVQQALKLSKDKRISHASRHCSVYESTYAIQFNIPTTGRSGLRGKILDRNNISADSTEPLILLHPDPDRFRMSKHSWQQRMVYEVLLPVAQAICAAAQ